MSLMAYNGVTFPYSFTTEFREVPLYDNVSGTDWHLTRYEITVQSIINHAYLFALAPDLLGNKASFSNPSLILNVIGERLREPRKQLSYKINGVEQIPARQVGTNPGSHIDAKNGPQPGGLSILQAGNDTFLISYSITAHYWENNVVSGDGTIVNRSGSAVLFNKWSETVDIDNANYSKRIREGTFAIRSDNKEGVTIDQIRHKMAMVGVPGGFLRESSSYTVQPDGLAMHYRVVDREVFKFPPSPAFEADGEYFESGTQQGGFQKMVEVRVRLKGSKTTDQAQMLQRALSVAVAKATLKSIAGGGLAVGSLSDGIPQSASIMVKLYENQVEARVRMLIPSGSGRVESLVMRIGNATTFTPFSDGVKYQPSYFVRGTASGLLLQAAAYYDPSLISEMDPRTGQMTIGVEPGRGGVVPS